MTTPIALADPVAPPAPTNVRVSVESNWANEWWLQVSWEEAWPTGWQYAFIHTDIDGVETCGMGAEVPEVPTTSCRTYSLLDHIERGHTYTVTMRASVYYDGVEQEFSSPPTSVKFTMPEFPPVNPTARGVKMPTNPTGRDWPTFKPYKRRYPASILPVLVFEHLNEGTNAKVLRHSMSVGERRYRHTPPVLRTKGRYTITRTVTFRPIVYRKERVSIRRRSYWIGSLFDSNYTCRIVNWTVAPGKGIPRYGDYDYTLTCTIPRVSLTPVTAQLTDADRDTVAKMATSAGEAIIAEQPGQQWVKHLGKKRTRTVRNTVVIR